jgi:hypothetical protein
MEHWQVADANALELIEFWGKIGKSGKRPRFKLNTKQQHTVSYLTEINSALDAAGEAPAWLHRPMRAKPLSGRSPLAHMTKGGQEAISEVLRILTEKVLRASLADGGEVRASKTKSQAR